MNTLNRVVAAVILAALGGGAQSAFAQATIKSISADRPRVVLQDGKATIRFTVDGDARENSNCGLIISYSGIDSPDNRKINANDGMLPKVVERVFTRAGAYDVRAKGGRVGSTMGCSGEAMVQIVVLDPEKPAVAVAPPLPAAGQYAAGDRACYRGWRFSQRAVDKKTGAFTCTPRRKGMQAPEKRIECPAGLDYFEKGATYGCSA